MDNRFSAIKKFPAFYRTRMFITAFTSAHHPSYHEPAPFGP